MNRGFDLDYRKLGGTGIKVSDVGLGCWAIGGASFKGGDPTGWSGADIEESVATVRYAAEVGVSFFDTADAYGRGKSEVLVGMGLAGHKQQAVIATKVGNSLAAPEQNFTEPYIRGALDASLTRLEVEQVDLYLLHGPPVDVMSDELFGVMRSLKTSGKIRAWGVSIASVEEGLRAIDGGAEIIQLVYNILHQDIGNAILPIAQEQNVGIIARVPLASGWLTGKYDAGTVFQSDDHRSLRYPPAAARESAASVAKLDFLLDEADTLAEGSLRFVLSHPAISTVIPGARTRDQVRQNMVASGKVLSERSLSRIQDLFR